MGVELRKLFGRRRTWLAFALLNVLPTLVAGLLAWTRIAPRPGEGPAFLAAVTANGSLFAIAALAIVLPLFLPVAVAVAAGESVAGEAQSGTLRYLLLRPVGRTRLLLRKLVAVSTFVVVAVLGVALVGFVVGRLLLGNAPVSQAMISVSGSVLSPWQIAWRTGAAIAFVTVSMLCVAAMGLFLSTVTDAPQSATLGALAFLIGSSVLLTLDAARPLQPYLPTRYWLSFVDLYRDPILWSNIERGVGLQVVYLVVLLGAAWANFTTKDITS
ncbi:ABC transporter permease [Pedococcus sp. 5OH_020]|uniref:ABC transporter permease n=1 Tax=Pedococcus sp. 5OH_020 TaxID=2989814 RepID=UPI0022E9B017|nr:ABC transporter permease [Pedococcus sp. 5OH_020]